MKERSFRDIGSLGTKGQVIHAPNAFSDFSRDKNKCCRKPSSRRESEVNKI